MEEKESDSKSNKLRCKKCNSSQVYLRIKTQEVTCRSCGYISKKEA